MPLDFVTIERVDPCKTANPSVTSYTITAKTVDEQPRTVQFGTISNWQAALCERAKATGQYVWIGSKDTRYGQDIVTITLDDSKFNYDAEAL